MPVSARSIPENGAIPLFLSRFTVCVALIACGLAGGLILDDARDAVFLSFLVDCGFGFGDSLDPRLLIALQAFSLGLPFFPGCRDCLTLCLTCEPGRLGGFLCGTIGFQQSGLRFGSGAAAISEIIVFLVLQVSVPFRFWSRWAQALMARFDLSAAVALVR
jgi:hypothetical protein